MLQTICRRVARALVAGQRRARRAALWGSFDQRTIDRRRAAGFVWSPPFALVCPRCGYGAIVQRGPLPFCYCALAAHA